MNHNTIKVDLPSVRMIAHRGVSGLERENTCPAFLAAGNRTYWGVETDVRRTADGKYVILHDADTSRVSKDAVRLVAAEVTAEELSRVVLPDKDYSTVRQDIRVPLLVEYVKICKKYEKYCVLELKCDFSEAEIQEILDVFRAEEYLDRLVIISFHMNVCLRARALLPDNHVQFLAGELSDANRALALTHRLDVDLYWKSVTEALIEDFHANGLWVNAYTVDDPAAAAQLAAMGIDLITTNILE